MAMASVQVWRIAVAGVVAVLLLLWSRRRRRRREGIGAPPAPPAAPPRELRQAPSAAAAKGPPPTESPLAPALVKALERALPSTGQGRPAPWAHDEVRDLAGRMVARINNRTPGLGLGLVSFDAVSKLVEPTGTTRYTFDAQLHAPAKGLSARATFRVDVDAGGREYVRDIAVHGAAKDVSAVRGAVVSGPTTYATYEPVVRYEPRL